MRASSQTTSRRRRKTRRQKQSSELSALPCSPEMQEGRRKVLWLSLPRDTPRSLLPTSVQSLARREITSIVTSSVVSSWLFSLFSLSTCPLVPPVMLKFGDTHNSLLLQLWLDKRLNQMKNHVMEHRTCSSGQDASSLLPSLLSLSLSP